MASIEETLVSKILQIRTAEEADSISPELVGQALDLLRQLGVLLRTDVTELQQLSAAGVPDGTVVCVPDGASLALWRYSHTTGKWSKLTSPGIIRIAGVRATGTAKTSSSSATGSATNIYYYEDAGRLGLSTDGGSTYYMTWGNQANFGVLTNGEVLPIEGRVYVPGDSANVYVGGGDALNAASITNAMTASVSALLAWLASGDSGSEDDPVTYAYDAPVISTLTYPTSVSASGGTLNVSSLLITQVRRGSDGSTSTLSWTSLSSLPSGSTKAFALQTAVTGFSINATTGKVTVTENTSTTTRSARPTLRVTINGVQSALKLSSQAIVQTAAEEQPTTTLYIAGLSYIKTGTQYITATPVITDQNGTTWTKEQYDAEPHEAYTIAMKQAGGATLDASTGIVTMDTSVALTGMANGDLLGIPIVEVTQTDRAAVHASIEMFSYSDAVQLASYTPARMNSSRNAVRTGSSATYGETAKSIQVAAGDIYFFHVLTPISTWLMACLTSTAFVSSSSSASSSVTVTNAPSPYVDTQGDGYMIYKVPSAGWLSCSAFLSSSSPSGATFFYKKLN